MSRWIDADAVIARIAGQMSYEIEVETGNETDCVDLAEELLNDIPSIDIVRCKKCKYYAEHNELYINEPTTCVKHSVIGHYVVVNHDDFCSYGEHEDELNCSEKPNNCDEPQYEMGMGTLKCDNCSEYGSFKCTKCDGEMYFKRLEAEDEPQTDCDHRCVQTEIGCEKTDCMWK